MFCTNCGYPYSSGWICESCGYNNDEFARREQEIAEEYAEAFPDDDDDDEPGDDADDDDVDDEFAEDE